MIRPDGRACVIDLGVARHLDQTTLTALGITWGTLGYMSPEQTRAVRQLTCKSDLFSLGVILLESAWYKSLIRLRASDHRSLGGGWLNVTLLHAGAPLSQKSVEG